jgi:DNA polymerase III epsilon subunit-like protein
MSLHLSDQLEERIRELLESPEKLSSRAFLGVNAALDAAVKLQRVRRLEQEVQHHEVLQIRLRLRLYELCRQLYSLHDAIAPRYQLNFGDDVLAYGLATGVLRAQHANGGLKIILDRLPAAVLPNQGTGSTDTSRSKHVKI